MSFFSEIKCRMEHNDWLNWLAVVARKTGFVHALHVTENFIHRKENRALGKEFQEFYRSHEGDFEKLTEMLADDFLRFTLARVLEFRKNYDMRALKGVIVQPQYFPKGVFEPSSDEVFIDGGAYVGDTIQCFVKNWGGVQKNLCLGT